MMQRKVPALTLAITAAGLVACGSTNATPGGPASSSATASASASAPASSSPGSGLATAKFSCDIKPGAGLLPGATPKPGRLVATIAEIESATGLTVSSSVDISMISGYTQCRYQVGQGGQVDITVLNDSTQSAAELAKTRQQNLALHDRGCNGCAIKDMAAQADLGPDGYKATSDGNPVFGSITAGTYFEVEAVRLKDVRVERLALVVAGRLSGGASPSLPPLPTPTP
jgi:hypothetical protein